MRIRRRRECDISANNKKIRSIGARCTCTYIRTTHTVDDKPRDTIIFLNVRDSSFSSVPTVYVHNGRERRHAMTDSLKHIFCVSLDNKRGADNFVWFICVSFCIFLSFFWSLEYCVYVALVGSGVAKRCEDARFESILSV